MLVCYAVCEDGKIVFFIKLEVLLMISINFYTVP